MQLLGSQNDMATIRLGGVAVGAGGCVAAGASVAAGGGVAAGAQAARIIAATINATVTKYSFFM